GRLRGIDPRDDDLFAPERCDRGIEGLGHPLSGHVLSGSRPSAVGKCRHGPLPLIRYRATGGRFGSPAPGRCMPAPATTPDPRAIICSSSSFSDDALIADSSVIWRF